MRTEQVIALEQQYILQTYGRPEFVLERGNGVYLFDMEDNRYLDFVSGLAVNAFGYGDYDILKAIEQQAGKLMHCSNLYHIPAAGGEPRRITPDGASWSLPMFSADGKLLYARRVLQSKWVYNLPHLVKAVWSDSETLSFQAVAKGLEEQMGNGVIAGYPLINVRATLYDGSFHEVDSSEMAFKIAGSMAMREGAQRANPVLLEPVMAVEVVTPEDYMGDVVGDLSRRRGMIGGMDENPAGKIVRASVPLAEMFGYSTDLRSATQGRATFTMEFERYAEVPNNIAEGIIKKA